MNKILEVRNIQKIYGKRGQVTQALDNVSFEVQQGEFLGIMGASGSGKTTLLNCLSTLDRVTAGSIMIEGRDLSKLRGNEMSNFRKERLGFVFQDFNLLDTLNGFENIALALSIRGSHHEEILKRVEYVAKHLSVEAVLNKFPYEMSGGQRQRVAAARAIVCNPSIVLADEPTGALDSASSKKLLETFQGMNNQMDATILMVSHDPFAASYCSRILFLRDGKIFTELIKGNDDRKKFFNRIIEVVSVLGGDFSDAV